MLCCAVSFVYAARDHAGAGASVLRRHQRENVPVHSFTCHIISVPLYFFDEAEMSTGNKSPCTVHSEG